MSDELPRYNDPGRLLVEIVAYDPDAEWGRFEVGEVDYDGSAFWINEGGSVDYWLNEHLDREITAPGVYVIEGIIGHYHRGDWSWGEDDDVTWEFERVRPATEEERRVLGLQDGSA